MVCRTRCVVAMGKAERRILRNEVEQSSRMMAMTGSIKD